MPPKQPTHIRAWGTRYDTLPSSPPVSPDVTRDEVRMTSPDTSISPDGQARPKEDKQPHDASVFVGSLPSNVDQAELSRLLTVHLSEHAEIKGIKVVRDSKGGVCAFVQCEDALSASVFLQSLQSSPPKPFLGRILRYEPARAFRTLLVSYRMPSQVVIQEGINRTSSPTASNILEAEVPHAIRIWKPKNTKYHRIVYNGEAIEAERYARAHIRDHATNESEEAVYLQPLRFDPEAIVKLARYFGPLEKVSGLNEAHELVKVAKPGRLTPECYPPPHNAVRSRSMDSGCWEIKWDHRDDCVAALMALRRVPHLSVSWAHQPQNQHVENRHIQGYQYPLNYVQPRVQPKIDRFQPYGSPSFATPSESTSFVSDVSSNHSLRQSADFQDTSRPSSKSASAFGVAEPRAWVDPVTPPGTVKNNTLKGESPSKRNQRLDATLPRRIDWAETDFSSFSDSEYDSKVDWSVWGETTFERDFKGPSIIGSQSVCEISTPQRLQVSPPLPQNNEMSIAASPRTPRRIFPPAPVVPISQTFSTPLSSDQQKENGLEANVGREFDPTALFVGGLEACGPGAWTEEKVQAVFGRFGGLEYVRFIQPPYGNAAFAFVKYDNRNSPAQAILEEHNRVYAGRALKVQLRDVNPHRIPWKYNRGRGRSSHLYPSRKVMLSSRPLSHALKQEDLPVVQHSRDTDSKIEMAVIADAVDKDTDENPHESAPIDKQPQEGPMARLMGINPGEKYREWYDAPGATSPPEPGNASNGPTGPPFAAPAMSYPVPPGYYPVPWIPYPPQPGPYQMPYYGPYPAYPIPGAPVPPYPAPPGSDANGPVAGNHPWPGLMYNPYAPYFGPPRSNGAEQQIPTATNPGSQSTQVCQAPLVPSGFIQNDQGTLIAVYPPDALDQYMSGQSSGSGSGPSTSAQSITTSATWPSQIHPGSVSTYSVPPQAGNNPPRMYPVPTNPLWNSVPQPFPPMPPGLINGPATPTYNVNAAASVGDHHDHSGANSPCGKKQASRKDFYQQNSNRSSRTFNPRNGRGHIHNQNLTGNMEGVNSHYRNSQFVNNSDWNQYTRH